MRGLGRRGGALGVFADGRRVPREELLPRREGGSGGQAPASEPPSGGRCWTGRSPSFQSAFLFPVQDFLRRDLEISVPILSFVLAEMSM